MSMTTTPEVAPATAAARRTARESRAISSISLSRLMRVELRKMFDTRAGFWLLASVGILTVLSTGAVIAWAPDEAINLGTFSSAMGLPLAVLLPTTSIIHAALSVRAMAMAIAIGVLAALSEAQDPHSAHVAPQ